MSRRLLPVSVADSVLQDVCLCRLTGLPMLRAIRLPLWATLSLEQIRHRSLAITVSYVVRRHSRIRPIVAVRVIIWSLLLCVIIRRHLDQTVRAHGQVLRNEQVACWIICIWKILLLVLIRIRRVTMASMISHLLVVNQPAKQLRIMRNDSVSATSVPGRHRLSQGLSHR